MLEARAERQTDEVELSPVVDGPTLLALQAAVERVHVSEPIGRYMVDLVGKFGEVTGVLDQEWAYFTILADPAAQVFYDAAYLVDRWSRVAECLSVKPEAIGYQTALIFRKAPR